MKILEYDEVNALDVFQLNLLALGFALSPEHATHIRRTDPRPFPFLALYAVEDERVIGQVGVFRLPMVTTEGREDVGGVWAVSTHPEYAGRGIASRLLDEAHSCMREAGLRFSTLGTDRFRVAYKLYQQLGYVDTQVLGYALAPWNVAHQPTRLRAQPVGSQGYDLVDQVFAEIAKDYLGFSWRHTPFIRLRDRVALEDIWILWKNKELIGYALTHKDNATLDITSLLVKNGTDAAEAIAAVISKTRTPYIRVKLSRPSEIASLRRAGYHVAYPSWDAFMIKPLVPEVSYDDAVKRFGLGTDQFMISWLDIT